MIDKKYNECSLLTSLRLRFGNVSCNVKRATKSLFMVNVNAIYSQDNTSEMFINIPFIFAGSKIM